MEDPSFRRGLATRGIVDLRVSDPSRAKHTETTQRFRVALVLGSGQQLPTKIEFSRRGINETLTRSERVDAELARRHGRSAYYVTHYIEAGAALQKIDELAGRPRPQARDLFDLALLDARGAVDGDLLRRIEASVRDHASVAIASLEYADWEGQVLEYLDDDAVGGYGSLERFEQIRGSMLERLRSGR